MQGGHHPKLGIDYYLNLLQYIRQNHPTINIHGFSPPEFNHFAEVFGMNRSRKSSPASRTPALAPSPAAAGEILVDKPSATASPRSSATATTGWRSCASPTAWVSAAAPP